MRQSNVFVVILSNPDDISVAGVFYDRQKAIARWEAAVQLMGLSDDADPFAEGRDIESDDDGEACWIVEKVIDDA